MPATAAPTSTAATRRRTRAGAASVALVVVLVLAAVASLTLGTRPVALATALQHFTGGDVAQMDAAVLDQRAVRTLWAATIGAALALAGAGMQGVTRNPLGDPGILGINAGAACAVVVGISFFGVASATGFAVLALFGAGLASVLVYALAAIGRDGATPVKLALMGAAITAALGSFTSALILQFNDALDSLRTWQLGSVAGANMANYFPGALLIAIGAAILVGGARTINNFALGDDMATALGENVALKRFILFVGITLLAGTATSMTGPIAFLGLMAPHALRTLIGPDYRKLIPLSAVLGAALLIIADTIGRIVLPPEEVQVGVMMVVMGVPAFIAIVRSHKVVGL
ncbi:iron ABC transporter permease [Rothia sp. LK2588]|uniref:FecCD family ABC transporter permease n=1 Tax=Rothia sp. LK2588 TaxID=3114369 RepID=UPI0034CEB0CE